MRTDELLTFPSPSLKIGLDWFVELRRFVTTSFGPPF